MSYLTKAVKNGGGVATIRQQLNRKVIKVTCKSHHLHKNISARWNVENDVGEHLTTNHRQGGL